MSYSIAYASGGKEDIQLTPLKSEDFKGIADIITQPLPGEKGKNGYFIRGGELELQASYETSSGNIYKDIYPRCDLALLSADFLVIDADRGKEGAVAPDLKEISQVLKLLKINHCGYTTASHSKEAPKCRVIIPCKLPDKGALKASMAVLKKELANYECYPIAGGSEETVWSNPWFFGSDIEDFDSVIWCEGSDFPAILDSPGVLQHLPVQTNNSSFDSMVKIINKGEKNTGVHEAITKYIHGALEDGLNPTMLIATLQGLLRPDSEHYHDYYKEIPRLVKAKLNKIKVDWEVPRPLTEFLYDEERPVFPIELLPYSMQEAAKAIGAYQLMAPEDVATVLIAVVSSAINRKALIDIDGSHQISAFHVGFLYLAKSGDFKSAVYNKCVVGLERGQAKAGKVLKREKTLLDRDVLKAQRFKDLALKKPASKINKDAPTPTLQEILNTSENSTADLDLADRILERSHNMRVGGSTLDNITEERAVMQTYRQGGYANYMAPEAQAFFQLLADAYGKNQSKTDFLIRGLVGDYYSRKRQGKSDNGITEDVEFNPVLNVLVLGQPDVLALHAKNQMLYSTGFMARLAPIYWKSSWKEKTIENSRLDESKVSIYNHIIEELTAFIPENNSRIAILENVEEPPEILIQPCTKLASNENPHLYIDLFNEIRVKCAPFGDWAGEWELINKTITIGYTLAACCYAYDNYEEFYTNKSHKQNRTFFNLAKAFTYYIIDCKLAANADLSKDACIKNAQKIIKKMINSARIEQYYIGMKVSDFNNDMKAYGGNSMDLAQAELYSETINLLINYGWLKILPTTDEKTGKSLFTYYLNRKALKTQVAKPITNITSLKVKTNG